MTDIAIAGIDCRFPRANTPDELWELLISGGDGMTEVPESRWRADDFYDPAGSAGSTNTRSGGFVQDADAFDREFFGMSEEDAATCDPQVRLLLQSAWRALEDACLDPRTQAGSNTGVYVGIMSSDWFNMTMTDFPNINKYVASGNGFTVTANRVSHALDLRGPSMAIDTFCSSSLVAAHNACVSLRAGEIDQALVAGVNLLVTPATSIYITQAGLSSPDGRCKPFSSGADGFGRGEGVAVVVLRRVEDAVAAGLPIYAVIKGGAVNHDGRSPTGVTSPNIHAQQDVMREAYRRSGVRPQDITFVEAHGTGTIMGDRMEARALTGVHGVPREQPCAIGSIKGNIGHSEGAAGIAALIKTAMALRYGVVPPSRYADTENPRLRLAKNGLKLLDEPLKLPAGTVLGSISSFGLGGTNAHVVLASAPEAGESLPTPVDAGMLTVSSHSLDGVRTAVRTLAADIGAQPRERLGQLCWTSNVVKSSGPVRFALPVLDGEDPVSILEETAVDTTRLAGLSGQGDGDVVPGVLLPGAEAVYAGMSVQLHDRIAAYRAELAAVDEAMAPSLGRSVRDLVLHDDEAACDPELARAAVFAVDCALGRVLIRLGLKPAWMIGEGVGQYAAAVLSGALSIADACELVLRGGDSGAVTWNSPAVPVLSAHGGGSVEEAGLRAVAEESAGSEAVTEAVGAVRRVPSHLVEIGPLPRLTPVVQRALSDRALPGLVPCPGPAATGRELLEVLACLYRDGLDPRWEELYAPEQRVTHRLTPYEFDTSERFWKTTTVSGHRIGPVPAANS